MASESEATCEEDPNFAAICAFFEKFGQLIGITDVDFCELQSMLENTHEVPKFLSELHIKLLRKIKKNVSPEKWEKCLIKFCHTFSNIDAWELERFGYKKAKLSSKVRVLKELLDAQFDLNTKFKVEINKLTSTDLRSQPLGRDKFGHAYWFQSDDNYQIRVYKEDADLDDDKWTLVAKDKTGLVSLISHLNDGDVKISSDSAGNEDSNSLSEKPIIDTGQQDTDSKRTSEDEDSNLMETNVDQEKESENKEKERESEEVQETEEKELESEQEKEIDEKEREEQEIEEKQLESEGVQETEKERESEEEQDSEDKDDDRLVIEEDDVEEEADPSENAQEDEKPESTHTKQESLTTNLDKEQEDKQTSNEKDEEIVRESDEENSENKKESKTNLKRPREDDSDDSETSVPKPKIQNLAAENTQEPVVGEAIEEPVMTVEGEGSGSDNQCPIVGEAIEEELFFVYGNGSGADCQTGKNSDTESANVETTKAATGIASSKDISEIANSPSEGSDKCEETIEKENGGDECESKISQKESDNKLLPKASENNVSNSKNSSDAEENLGEPQPKGTIQVEEGKTELDVNSLSDKTEAPEPVCIKRSAYVCGEENNDSPIENNDTKEENGKEIIESEEDTKYEKTTSEAQPIEFANDVEEQTAKEEDKPIEASSQDRPKKKAAKGAQRKNVAKAAESEDKEGEENSAESSITNSPRSANDNSLSETANVSADPLAVVLENKDAEVKTSEVKSTLTSFSLDFNESTTPTTPIDKPSPLRALRKRGMNVVAAKAQEPEEGKRLKLKGRRSVDAALRRSVEQRIEQLHGSSSDSKDSEEEQQAKTKKAGRFMKKKSPKKEDNEEEDSQSKDLSEKKVLPKATPVKKYSRMLLGLKIDEDDSCDRPLRQSRRIAQLKIKEQAKPRAQLAQEARERQKLEGDKRNDEPETEEEEEDEEEYSGTEGKKTEKKKKKKKEKPVMFNEKRPWQSSSEDSEDAAEEEEEEMIDEEDDAPLGPLQSDHEFSPESEEDDGEEWTPVKRARTARKESDAEQIDDFPCQKCIKSDHPEWILLCDKCDNGWHCSCLRPPLLVIPEGDWFCPPCQHIILLERLQAKLVEYDKKLSKKEIEDRRKERLAYVGISLNNVLPSKEPASDHRKKKKRRHSSEEVSESSYESESESEDSDEPIYQLRQRRQTKSYKFNEYDDLIKDAIGEDINKTEDSAGNLGRGKDIQTIVKGLEEEKEEEEKAKEESKKVEERPTTANLKKMLRKKHRKLNSLDFDSEEEDISDEDFKGGSESEEEEDEDASIDSEDSDDYVGKKRRKHAPVRRSTRARTRKYDEDFIDDDTDDDAPKKKKKKSIWDETESDESDASGYGKRKFKKKKKVTKNSASKNRRIKYGGLTSSEEENYATGRRTRGKKATYVDTLGTDDSEEQESVTKKNPRRIVSDDDHDEDFVANEDEVEDEKDSEEKVEDDEEEADEEYDSEEEERRKKLPLIVPKIYIKKPLGPKRETPQGVRPVEDSTQPEKIPPKPSAFAKLDVHLSSATAKPRSTESVKEILKLNIEARLSEAGVQLSRKENEEMASKQQRCELLAAALKKPTSLHEPIVSNVSALMKNDSENEDLSEPPGIALPTFDEIGLDAGNCGESPKKRKGRPPKKKPEDIMNLSGKNPEPAIEIAAPPQPFSQAQPTPSVITRMLQSKPGISLYPVGRIRPKQFATMRDDDSDESSPKNSPASSPAVPHMGQYASPPPRGTGPMPYRHPPPPAGMNHYPPGMRGPPPHAFGHHRPPLGPSPAGGGPINLSEQGQPRGGPAINRYPAPVGQPPPGPRPPLHLYRPPTANNGPPYAAPAPVSANGPPPHQPYAPPTTGAQPQPYPPAVPSNNGPPAPYPPNSQPQQYPAAPPATVEVAAGTPSPTPPAQEGYYGTYPQPPVPEEDLPPPAYEGLPPEPGTYQEPYTNEDQLPSAAPPDGSSGKNYEEESGGEFAGLASYFSSQREDDLES